MVHFFGAIQHHISSVHVGTVGSKEEQSVGKDAVASFIRKRAICGLGSLAFEAQFNFISDRRMVTRTSYSILVCPGGDYPPVHSMHLRDSGPYRSTSPL